MVQTFWTIFQWLGLTYMSQWLYLVCHLEHRWFHFNGSSQNALILYGAQLAVNWAWSPIFFGAKNLGGGFATISVLWGLVAATVTGYEFFMIKPWAGYAFLPYLAWVSLATTLNGRTWKLNPKSIKDN